MNSECESVQSLLSGYMDGELTQQTSQKVYLHLEGCDSCQTMYKELMDMKQDVSQLTRPTMSEQQIEQLMKDVPSTHLQRTGWTLFIVSLCILCGVGVYEFAVDSSTPFWLKITISALVAGILFLLVSVIRQRIITRRSDRYKGVNL